MALRKMHRGYQISVTRSKGRYCYALGGKGKLSGRHRCGFRTEAGALKAGKKRTTKR